MRINLWSGPRNVSTALMYSFRQRSDTRVVDEPLYGHYLAVTGVRHPGDEDVVAAMDTDAESVIRDVILGPCDRPVLCFKQMAHHLVPTVPVDFLGRCVNVLLIRDPAEVLTTIVEQLPEPTMRDIGIERQVELRRQLRGIGQDPVILDARVLLEDPAGVLSALCGRIGLPWDPAMLSWPAGPKPEDGVWAPHWYRNAHRSTGFVPYRAKVEPVPEHLRRLADHAAVLYAELRTDALMGAAR